MLDYLQTTARTNPEAIALVQGSESYTYARLTDQVDRLAHGLAKLGAETDALVGLDLPNTAEFVIAYLALLRLGARPVIFHTDLNLGPAMDQAGITGLIGRSGPVSELAPTPTLTWACLDGPAPSAWSGLKTTTLGQALDSSPLKAPIPAEASACCVHTSGATGPPKAVVLGPDCLDWSVGVIIAALGLTPANRSLAAMPFGHLAGLLHLSAQLRSGGGLAVGVNGAFPGELLGAIKAGRVTGLPITPGPLLHLTKRYPDQTKTALANLRFLELSSEASPPELIDWLLNNLPDTAIYQTYGLTEAARTTYRRHRLQDEEQNSVGQANRPVRIVVVNGTGQPAPAGTEGEIYISGPNLASGYLNRPEETAARFTDQGFRTGDLGDLDDRGRLLLKGRLAGLNR